MKIRLIVYKFRSSKTFLVHGLPTDWIEEEIGEEDADFLKDVLEQKLLEALSASGLSRKVSNDDYSTQ